MCYPIWSREYYHDYSASSSIYWFQNPACPARCASSLRARLPPCFSRLFAVEWAPFLFCCVPFLRCRMWWGRWPPRSSSSYLSSPGSSGPLPSSFSPGAPVFTQLSAEIALHRYLPPDSASSVTVILSGDGCAGRMARSSKEDTPGDPATWAPSLAL